MSAGTIRVAIIGGGIGGAATRSFTPPRFTPFILPLSEVIHLWLLYVTLS